MTEIITIALLVIILLSALGYVIKSKKKGVKCIGCPNKDKCKNIDCH